MRIADLSCAELTALYRRRALSPVEVARDCLARIEANARFNAFMPIMAEPVLAAASASESR
ncbi:MAG TPA: amidase, partial [Pseudolabrys sp.]|nr:amidase [Pseudolabrys sp.]